MLILSRFPNHNDLINRDIAGFAVRIAKVQDTHFYLQHLTTQARAASAIDIEVLTNKP